jgi:hypothetical protein
MDIIESTQTLLNVKTAAELFVAVLILSLNLFMNLIFLRWLGTKLVPKFDALVQKVDKLVKSKLNDPHLTAIWHHETDRARGLGHSAKNVYYCADGRCGELRTRHHV